MQFMLNNFNFQSAEISYDPNEDAWLQKQDMVVKVKWCKKIAPRPATSVVSTLILLLQNWDKDPPRGGESRHDVIATLVV
jgi:hypothetical protein